MATKSPKNLRVENERLSSEVEALGVRLEEANQALEAIRTGQAESLVVEGPNGPRIFSLEGADHSYRVLVEAMNEGAATLAEDGTILYCNARFAEMLDAPLERAMGSSILWFLPARSLQVFEALAREASGGEGRGELELLSQAGRIVPAYLSVSVIHDDGCRRLCLVVADLRAQKRNEEILAAERLARLVLEQAADAIVVCDENGRIIQVSRSAAELCSGNPLHAPFEKAFPLVLSTADEWVPQESPLARSMRGEFLRAVPASLTLQDGSKADLLVSAKGLRGPQDRTIGCVVTIVDVTEHRRAEEALRVSEERLRLAIEGAEQGTWDWDLKANAMTCSEWWKSLLGLDQEPVVDFESFIAAVHPADRQRVADVLALAVRERAEVRVEHRIMRPDGTSRWVSARSRVFCDEHGEPARVSGTLVDITERKQLEEDLRAANSRLAEADRCKNDFLAVLSHELRNPLAPVRNSIYILERAVPGGDQARRALAVIDRQAGQLARLVDDLLDVTRIRRNKVRLQRQTLELNELVRRAMEDQRSIFENAEVHLELHPARRPVFVSADSSRLAQVVGNLLQNAAKFTGRGGATGVTVQVDEGETRASIHVADTGVGIAPELLLGLFQPFAQAESTLDRSQGGLGLGLTLVKGLVELHGGDVTAHSLGLGKGAEFVVRLPLAMAQATVPEPTERVTRSRRQVLIIEDNVDAADSLREALQFGEHEVEVAYSGPEGLAKAMELRPDVVLCDIGLPGMDGYEVARAFRADKVLKDTCLIALSGYALPEDLQRAQEAGFERHLAKPPSLEQIEELLAGGPPRSTDGSTATLQPAW